MPFRVGWSVLLLLVAVQSGFGRDDKSATGFQPKRRVREPTRLAADAATDGAGLPPGYDSLKQRYQLFAPEGYKDKTAWPLLVVVSPGDAPTGWRSWRKTCETNELLFAAPFGVRPSEPLAVRVRVVLDVLADVRRHYRIDPDRTYLVGFGEGAEIAGRIAFALPEVCGGAALLGGDAPMPTLDHLRYRMQERLSIALATSENHAARRKTELYLAPLLKNAKVRSTIWLTRAGTVPEETLGQIYRWLEEDVQRRVRDNGGLFRGEPNLGRDEVGRRAADAARAEMRKSNGLHRAVALIHWAKLRSEEAKELAPALELLREIRENAVRRDLLDEQETQTRNQWRKAEAVALDAYGSPAAARQAWLDVAKTTEGVEKQKAHAEAKRLEMVVANQPWLGMSLIGDTTLLRNVLPGGPADQAGALKGDLVEKFGATKVETAEQLRRAMQKVKPGDAVVLEVIRGGKRQMLTLKAGRAPE